MRRGDCRHNGTLDNCRLARQDSMLHSGQCGARIYAAFISKSAMHDVFAQKAGIMTLVTRTTMWLCAIADDLKQPDRQCIALSALGQKQTCAAQNVMSALRPKADMCGALAHVCFGPEADIGSHSITASASAINFAGIRSPSNFAVLRLMTNSVRVGRTTGSSAGSTPRSAFPTYRPTWR
jgi:hypothetical protein